MRYHRYGVFARYVIAVLRSSPKAKPALSDFAKLSIRHSHRIGWSASHIDRRVHAVETSREHLKRMRVEILGSLAIDRGKVEAEFTPGEPPSSTPMWAPRGHSFGDPADEPAGSYNRITTS